MPNVGLTFRPGATQPGRFPRVLGATKTWTISGVVYDGSTAPLVGYVCHLFDAATDNRIAITTTVAGGVYTFNPPTNTGYYYVVVFSADGTLVGGTPNTLIAT